MLWRTVRTARGSCKIVPGIRTAEVFDFLSEHFDDHVVALDYEMYTQGDMDCHSFSPDLTPCYYFIRGYLKEQVHRHNPQTIAGTIHCCCISRDCNPETRIR
ncbi:hypothetical protein AVEN_199362-1 [Araneus ventricosus]|uniref:Uncharacterized protein n=1 Tax=Araneus ventricosus TaxID=182803 RepID=A0A4Y2M2B9_ARAVE|nr:hypothetical protein AVEN_199362-1 [Araneus ventricosus]